MADADTTRLCTQIVHSHFGPLTANVASTLLTRGRLPLSTIIRYTGLKPRTVRASVLVLVQHNILWHTVSEDGNEVFEVNVDDCLARLRFGRYVQQAEELLGKAARDIVQIILDHGKLRQAEVLAYLAQYDTKAQSRYSQAMHNLVSSSYLKASTVLSHVSPRDKRIKYEAEEKAKITGFPTAKQLREAKELAEARLKRERDEAEKIGLKRVTKETGYKSSKRKAVTEEDVVDDDVYFRVNCERFNVHIRNKLIESAVLERFNQSAAAVIRATLKTTEAKQMSVSDVRSDPTSVANISQCLADDDDLESGLVLNTSKTPSSIALIKHYIGVLSAADNPTPAGKASSFVSMTNSKVQVEFEIIARRLRRRILENVTRERHGDEGVRILRLLMDTGKMDEKQVGKIAMMAPKDVRPLLSAMATDSIITIQEVPRSADRNPTRTFYLWFVDVDKAYSNLIRSLYKTLYNISRRRRAEEEEPSIKVLLEKRERTDVSLDESLLTRMERETLADWESKREKLTVLESRVEEAVLY